MRAFITAKPLNIYEFAQNIVFKERDEELNQHQRKIINQILAEDKYIKITACQRREGTTTALLIFSAHEAINNPNTRILFFGEARSYQSYWFLQTFNDLSTMWGNSDITFFNNGSRIVFVDTRLTGSNRFRGANGRSDIIIFDNHKISPEEKRYLVNIASPHKIVDVKYPLSGYAPWAEGF